MKSGSIQRWLAAVLGWAILIYIGTSSPFFSGPHTHAIFGRFDGMIRISGHVFEFFVLSFVLYGLAVAFRFNGWKGILFVLFIAFLLAISDEYHQLFVAGRSYKIVDIGKDLLGAFLALVIARIPVIRSRIFHIRPRYRRIVYYA